MSDAVITLRSTVEMDAGLDLPEIERTLSFGERLFNSGFIRKGILLVLLAVAWQVYAIYLDNELMFPTLLATLQSMAENCRNGRASGAGLDIPARIADRLWRWCEPGWDPDRTRNQYAVWHGSSRNADRDV